MRITMPALCAAVLASSPVAAKDAEPCAKDLICASAPTGVAAQMMRAGYQALLFKDGEGDPAVESAAGGYKFYVYFYGCENHTQCDSLQFYMSFAADPAHGSAAVDRWNRSKRFGQAALTKTGAFRVSYDLSTIGGVNQRNFGDVLEWWTSLIGGMDKFFAEDKPAAATPAPAKS